MSIWGEIKHGAEKVGGVVTGTADKAGGAIKDSAQDVFDKAMAAIVSRGARKALDLLLDEAKHAARGAVARVTLPVVPGFLHVRLKVSLSEKLTEVRHLRDHLPKSRGDWLAVVNRLTDHDTAGVVVRLPLIGTVLDQDVPVGQLESALERLAKRALKLF